MKSTKLSNNQILQAMRRTDKIKMALVVTFLSVCYLGACAIIVLYVEGIMEGELANILFMLLMLLPFIGISLGIAIPHKYIKIDQQRSIVMATDDMTKRGRRIIRVLALLIAGILIIGLVLMSCSSTQYTHKKPVKSTGLSSHPLWAALTQGRARRGLFMGWLIENYHFIDGVNDRLALAVAACTDVKIRPFFVKHYIEEWDHSAFFLKSLASFGVPRQVATATRPLPGTMAALNHMRRCARRDPLEYAACSGFLESTGEDREKAHRFFDLLTEHYCPERPQAIKPLADHVRLDESYQHNTVVEDICAQVDRISAARASAALNAAALLVETLEMWSTDILRSYDADEFVPRCGLHGHRPAEVAHERV